MKAVLALIVSCAVVLPAQTPTPPPSPAPQAKAGQAFTVDDEMAMRSLVDVAVAPDGSRVAYVVSTPVLARNEHEGALFVVPATGGTPARLGEKLHIFNTPTPRPQVRWSADS